MTTAKKDDTSGIKGTPYKIDGEGNAYFGDGAKKDEASVSAERYLRIGTCNPFTGEDVDVQTFTYDEVQGLIADKVRMDWLDGIGTDFDRRRAVFDQLFWETMPGNNRTFRQALDEMMEAK